VKGLVKSKGCAMCVMWELFPQHYKGASLIKNMSSEHTVDNKTSVLSIKWHRPP
jgi:hypothetical protein